MPFPDELTGPPTYSLMGCPLNAEWTPEVVREATGLTDRALQRIHRKFGFSPARVCASDPQLIAGFIRSGEMKQNKADEPDMALEQRAMQQRDENGEIPPSALLNALVQRQQILEPPPGKSSSYLPLAAGVSDTSWTWLGPGNIGGRVRAISPNPSTPGDILVGSVSGGIWRTTNGGSSWAPMDDFMPNVAISCLVRDPTAPATVYACTGEGVANIDSVRGLGLFKSTTSGASWTQVPSTNPSTAGTDWYFVNRLAIHPTNPAIMLAATNGGLYRTTNGTAASPTWTKVYETVGTGFFRKVMDVAFHPTDGNIALLGEGRHSNCTTVPCVIDGSAVAYSGDAGATWSRTKLNTSAIGFTQGRVEIAFSKSSPNIAYALVDMSAGQIYKSTDSGQTWVPNSPVGVPAHLGSQGWYGNSIWVAPNDPNRLIVGGVTLKMSVNGGASWTGIGGTGGSMVHVDHHALVSDPNYASNFTVYNGNDGGVYKFTGVNTATPSTTSPAWVTLNNGLGITQFYGAAGKAGGRITGGTQDNGTLLWTGTTNWTVIWGNDGGDSAADSSDGNYVYGMTQYGGVVRYTQALSATPPAFASQYICTGAADASCNFNNPSPKILFVPPMAIDPMTNTTLFLGAQQLWRSTNIKTAVNTSVSWTSVRPATPNATYISAIAIAPGNSDLVWIGYQDGQLACSTNATATTPTWTTVAGGVSRYVTRITMDPSNANRVYVAYGGYTSPNLRMTTSGCVGAPAWTSIHNQLPSAPIRAIEIHPNNPSWLYAGTEVGIFTSEDLGAHWTTTNDGPGTVSVEELKWLDSSTLLAATHGRGVFRASVLPGGAPVFTSSPPPDGTQNVAYSHAYTANGTPAPTFSVTSGTLPTGLTLNGTTGALTGTPTVAGPFTGVVSATNASGTANQAFNITIQGAKPGAPTIGSATPGVSQATISFSPPGYTGTSPITSYTVTCNPGGITATGASSPITVTGLSNGVAYTCSVAATNSSGTGASSSTVGVTPSGGVPLFSSAPPPGGTFGVPYSHTYTGSGSPAPTFSVTSGALPTGLSLNGTTGALTGTPSATGTFTGIVTATNSSGTATQAFSITIAATVPGAPTIGTATPGNGQATISFTAPASNGGSAITSYTATCNPGGITAPGAGSPITVTGLTNAVAYTCSVKANNAVGASAASGTVGVTPGVAPAFTSAAPPGGTFNVAYSHDYNASGAPAPTFSVTSGALPAGLSLNASSGLLDGTPTTAGTFTGVVTAANSAGSATQAFSITIAGTVPGAPTIGAATAGNGQATISFTAPASNGGSAITSYTATCNPGGITGSGAGSPVTVTGLTNGVTYTCSVKANNAVGASAASGTVSVTPASTPVFTSAAPPGGTFNVAYSHDYNASGVPAPTFSVTSGTLPTGLSLNASSGILSGTPSATGTFTGVVTATNAAGSVTQSFSITIAATVPDAPTIGAATPGNGQATISFTPSVSNGGSAIASYTATCNPGAITASGAGSPITVTGLTNGVTYTCSVKANNAVGASPASGTVSVAPGLAPAFTSAAPAGGTFNVAYSHTYTASGAPAPTFSVTSGALPTGLSLNGTTGALTGTPSAAGTFTGVVTAANSSGTATQAFSIVIAATVPGVPTIGTATPGNAQATIAFTPPASNGGSAITSYTATCNPGGITGSGAGSPVTVTGLTNGVAYTCSVKANNAVGASAASGTVGVTPGVVPAFTSAAPPGGTFNVAYSHTYTASGAPAPTFSVTSGALPTGLSLNASSGLLNGTPTTAGNFSGVVTATNTAGAATQAFSITIAGTVPGAPTIGSGTPGSGLATIAFSPPALNGGSAITSYTATCNPGGISASGASSPITVTGLTNGVAYTCSVTATNATGTGAASGTVSVTPVSTPVFTSAPPPGGSPGVAYSHTYTANGVPAPTFSLTSGTLPTGLILNGTTGALTGTPTVAATFNGVVTATNSGGTATQAFSIVIAASAPGAPTIGTATPGNAQATISFTPPASNGGSAITSYTATCNPGGITASGAGSPITVTGLTNGVAYTCSVTATNATGTGAASGTVGVTPGLAPAFTSAAPAGGTFNVAYSHTYTASGSPAPTFSVTSGALPTGLSLNSSGALSGTPTAAGTFNGVVTATNSAGSATQAFSIAIAATVPGAPTIGTATSGNGQATIGFTAPASNGGSAITSYTATCNPGGITAPGAASPITVTGLTNGVTYTCSVKANNAVGASAASGTVGVTPGLVPAFTSAAPPGGTFNVAYSHTYTASGSPAPTFNVTSGALPTGLSLNSSGALSGTPTATGTFNGVVTATNSAGSATQAFSITIAATVPGAPTIGTATPGNGLATISFAAPASNGGSAITSYTATCNPGAITGTGAGSPINVTGLTNGITYTCSVKANNAAGASAASGTVNVTPGLGPAFTSAAPPGGTFNVAYSHTYTSNGSPAPTFSVTSGALPTGLSLNGTTGALTGTPSAIGTFTGVVTASNSSGTATQAFSITIAASVPGAPTIGTATPGNAQATISFTPPAFNGGSAITSYTATCNPGGITASGAGSPITVTGLTNGVAYTCSVKANNAAGASAASGTVGVTPGVAPAFTSAAPPGGTFNVAYSHTYTASGAPAPTFSVTSGSLPAGLSLNPSSGLLGGTPTTAGTFTGVVTATNTAGTATQSFSITIVGTVPGAPTIGIATPGNGQASISFTPPASNGGSPITSYIASCNPGGFSGTGVASPIVIGGLSNNTTYTCSVRAINAIGTGAASGTVSVTPVLGVPLSFLSVASRKTHGSFGTYEIAIDSSKPINGAVTVEPRIIGAGHKIVFTFNDAIANAGTPSSKDAAAVNVGTASALAVGNTVVVTLTGVPDNKRVTVSLGGVNGSLSVSASMGFLVGDVNGSGSVTATDILKVQGGAGTVSASNFIYDLNTDGSVSLTDIVLTKSNAGLSLP